MIRSVSTQRRSEPVPICNLWEGGICPREPRPARPSAFAAGLGADALPSVVLFLLFVGGPNPFKSAYCGKGGFARLSLRPSMAPAFAAGLGAVGLPCVAHRGHSWFNPGMKVRSVPAQRRLLPVQIPPSAMGVPVRDLPDEAPATTPTPSRRLPRLTPS